jgi:hypothetical protein
MMGGGKMPPFYAFGIRKGLLEGFLSFTSSVHAKSKQANGFQLPTLFLLLI